MVWLIPSPVRTDCLESMLESVARTSHRSSLTTHSNGKMTARYHMEIHGGGPGTGALLSGLGEGALKPRRASHWPCGGGRLNVDNLISRPRRVDGLLSPLLVGPKTGW